MTKEQDFTPSWKCGEEIPKGTRVRYVGAGGKKAYFGDPMIGATGTALETSSCLRIRMDAAQDHFHICHGLCEPGHGWGVCSHYLQRVEG